jgi:hypothetical protein
MAGLLKSSFHGSLSASSLRTELVSGVSEISECLKMVRVVSDLRLGVVGTPERYDRKTGLEKDREKSPA